MAKKNNPVSKARSRKPAPVKKPFPIGFLVGALVLILALGSLITYAAMNQGVGDKSSLKYAQSQIDGLQSKKGLSSSHRGGPLEYPNVESEPPVGGDHNATPSSCLVYDKAIANEYAVHSLEHGAVWVTYQPDLPAKELTELKKLVEGDPYRMLSPYPGLKSKISLQAWGEQLFVDKVSDSRVERFLDLFTAGPQTQEPGAACQGTTETGPIPAAVAPAPSPTVSANPSATPAPTPSK